MALGGSAARRRARFFKRQPRQGRAWAFRRRSGLAIRRWWTDMRWRGTFRRATFGACSRSGRRRSGWPCQGCRSDPPEWMVRRTAADGIRSTSCWFAKVARRPPSAGWSDRGQSILWQRFAWMSPIRYRSSMCVATSKPRGSPPGCRAGPAGRRRPRTRTRPLLAPSLRVIAAGMWHAALAEFVECTVVDRKLADPARV